MHLENIGKNAMAEINALSMLNYYTNTIKYIIREYSKF